MVLADADALLEQIHQNYLTRGAQAAQSFAKGYGILMREARGLPLVPVIVDRQVTQRADFPNRLTLAQARVDALSRDYGRILVPMPRLSALIDAFPTERLRAPIPVHPVSGVGSIVSESVSLTAADGYQVGNLDGTGVKVAVVDLGFAQLNNALSQGELPANSCDAGRSADFTGTGLQSGSKHGTGVAEHVMDMAPGVELYCLKIGDEVDLQNAADYIAANNIRIANHSVAWAIASYYDDSGPINGIINDSFDNDGVFWTVSSGNSARQHWRGIWADTDSDNRLEFTANDELLELSGSASTITIFLNWDQYGAPSKADLRLSVVDNTGASVASSNVNQNFYDPAEAVSFAYQASQAPYSVVVERIRGNVSGLDVTLFSFSHNFEYPVAAASIMDPASAHGAFTVGAVNQASWTQTNPAIRGYSSQGPSTDGRQKPQLVAPDGTASLTYGVSNGTSFSSPTTAGAAALLLQEDATLTAPDLTSLLSANAIDVGTSGPDPTYGAGKLQLPLIDSDSDGLTNVEEIRLGTNALNADSDSDGLSDFDEDRTYGTDPLNADSDSDGLNDFEEVITYQTDPLNSDSDADGLSDNDEVTIYTTDPLSNDSDSDGLSDFDEVITYNTNPLASNRGDLGPRGAPDDLINAGDYVVLTRLVTGAISPTTLELTLGDLNNNGGLDSGDLVLLMRVIQGQIPIP